VPLPVRDGESQKQEIMGLGPVLIDQIDGSSEEVIDHSNHDDDDKDTNSFVFHVAGYAYYRTIAWKERGNGSHGVKTDSGVVKSRKMLRIRIVLWDGILNAGLVNGLLH
jgi:hypothetical protein